MFCCGVWCGCKIAQENVNIDPAFGIGGRRNVPGRDMALQQRFKVERAG